MTLLLQWSTSRLVASMPRCLDASMPRCLVVDIVLEATYRQERKRPSILSDQVIYNSSSHHLNLAHNPKQHIGHPSITHDINISPDRRHLSITVSCRNSSTHAMYSNCRTIESRGLLSRCRWSGHPSASGPPEIPSIRPLADRQVSIAAVRLYMPLHRTIDICTLFREN
ncbi:hypothetical protein GGS21DRAFT_156446 [Xylaria nigripes]|nr:hypothetical protein GGS21DRAFT_156446 [Xylaria nigripes]